MNPWAVFLLLCFPTIHKKHFFNIFHNCLKPENILKLSPSFTSIKSYVKYVKIGKGFELATCKNNSVVTEAKSVTQLLRCFLLYDQIILHFTPITVQFKLQSGLAMYVNWLLSHFIVYTWETVRLFHFYFYQTKIAIGIYNPESWKTPSTDLKLFCLLRKLLQYTNFTNWSAPISYFGLPIAERNLYFSNHNHTTENYQESNSVI